MHQVENELIIGIRRYTPVGTEGVEGKLGSPHHSRDPCTVIAGRSKDPGNPIPVFKVVDRRYRLESDAIHRGPYLLSHEIAVRFELAIDDRRAHRPAVGTGLASPS